MGRDLAKTVSDQDNRDKQRWLDNLATTAETAARTGNQGTLYKTLRTLSGKVTPPTACVKALDGSDLDTPEQQLDRWREHFCNLLNRPPPPPSPQLESLVAEASEDDSISADPPTQEEVLEAIGKLKPGRAAGVDGIPPELLLKGGPAVAAQLHVLITAIWRTETVPMDWLHGIILPFWKKGPKDNCGNYRGITLLSVPGKVLAHIILARLRPLLLSKQRREQSGFTPGRSTVDRILTLRILAELRREYRKPLFAAYVDLKQAFDSVDRPALWKILKILGAPTKLMNLLSLLYSTTTSSVRVNGQTSASFNINSGVRQGCVLAPIIFNTAIDFVMGRTISQSACGASFGNVTITDLDYADDVAILAEIMQALNLALHIMDSETRPLGLQISWQKTKVQSLSDYQPPPANLTIESNSVEVVDKFTYLGSTISSDCRSTADIKIRIGRSSAAMASLNHIWSNGQISTATKLRLYNSLVLSVLLYGAEAWTLTATEERHLDTFDQKCLRRILGYRWYDFVSNSTVRQKTGQPPVSHKIRQARLRLFGHLARAEPPLEAASLLRAATPAGWSRPRGRPRRRWGDQLNADLSTVGLDTATAWLRAQDRTGWKSTWKGATLPGACGPE
ncbi:hypothetical protein Bbelb_065790 [Branchiostoma belcheri]|nr:hypothetical protein Bbelb_065790 [Branchiostoma belcheri]